MAAMAAKKAKAGNGLKITLKKSLIGSNKSQIATAKALGLNKVGSVTIQPDNDATKGKIKVLSHLLDVTPE